VFGWKVVMYTYLFDSRL